MRYALHSAAQRGSTLRVRSSACSTTNSELNFCSRPRSQLLTLLYVTYVLSVAPAKKVGAAALLAVLTVSTFVFLHELYTGDAATYATYATSDSAVAALAASHEVTGVQNGESPFAPAGLCCSVL